MKEHGTPDSALTLPGIKLPLYSSGVCVCAVTQTLQSHTWRDLTPLAFRNFLIPAQLPAKNDLQPTKETYSQRSSHPPSQLAGYWEVPG